MAASEGLILTTVVHPEAEGPRKMLNQVGRTGTKCAARTQERIWPTRDDMPGNQQFLIANCKLDFTRAYEIGI